MADAIEAKIIPDFAQDVATKLNEAAVIAQTADDFGKRGLAERAFQSLLQIEPLIHKASILLNAASIVHRRDHSRPGNLSS